MDLGPLGRLRLGGEQFDGVTAAIFDHQLTGRRAARGRLADPGIAHGDRVTDLLLGAAGREQRDKKRVCA